MDILITCIQCGANHIVHASSKGLAEWSSGTPIQFALPELSAADRELLISNICNDCFDNMFAEHAEYMS